MLRCACGRTPPTATTRQAGQDRGYALDQGTADTATLPACDTAIMPAADTNTGPLAAHPSSLTTDACDSQAALAYSSTKLDDDLRNYVQPIALIANSMGGAITRGWLTLAQSREASAPDPGFDHVDTVFFLQGAQGGSYLAGANQALADAPFIGDFVQGWINQKLLYGSFNLSTNRPATGLDLAPRSSWYESVNSAPVPARIHYYNLTANIQLHITDNWFTWITGLPNPLPMGDLVMKPGSDDPSALPDAEGERFLPGGVTTTDRYEWTISRIHTTSLGDISTTGQTVLADPATHFNLGTNLDNTSNDIPNCQAGPSGTQTSALTPIGMLMAVLADPANGCMQR